MKRLVFAIVLVACGGGSKPVEEPGHSTKPSSPSGGGASSSPPDAGGDPESCKKNFVADCSKDDPGTAAYCGCAWDIAKTSYGESTCMPSTEDLQ